MKSYDYIITGAGASGLMTAYRMSLDTYFDGKEILILDKENKNSNDRTWCYWEEGKGEWDHLLAKKWNNIYFRSTDYSEVIPLDKYHYKMLRSGEFYAFLWEQIGKKKNILHIQDEVISYIDLGNSVTVKSRTAVFETSKLINSIFHTDLLTQQDKYPYLKQHFVGWFVKADDDVFDDKVATFMDFNLPQNGNTRFMYVLPLSKTHALIEYTLFSEHLLPVSEYETAIEKYMEQIGIKNYMITEKEQGNIPMTSFPFEKQNTKNILHIGSAGGWTKASTGYTFALTTKKSKELVQFLKTEGDLSKFYKRSRYWFFDLIFLGVLHRNNELGSSIFASIFKNNKTQDIFRFLDEKGSWYSDLKIIFRTRPKINFTSSFLRNLPLILFG
ncbi:MAG: lycopene cyclase [Saprospiraceae bacterium]|nr:lycopene cyclase [Saprospiraceae bacterium]